MKKQMSQAYGCYLTSEPEYINHMRFLIELEASGNVLAYKRTGTVYADYTGRLLSHHGVPITELHTDELKSIFMIERDIRKEILGQEIKIEKDQEEG